MKHVLMETASPSLLDLKSITRLINSDTSGVYNSDITLSHRQNNPGYCRVDPGRASVLMCPK